MPNNMTLEDAATTIWAAAEGCIDYPHLDRLALPAAEVPTTSIQERVQRHEEEAAAYQRNLVESWTITDSFFRHVNECVDPECSICQPHEDNDSIF